MGRFEYIPANIAIAEGAMAAGLDFFAGYPITPASDLFEYLAEKLPERGGVVVQFEDEIGSINAVVGAAWAGAKAMTATSGPGFSLMVEGLGLAIMTETPLVLVDVMRAGPSTGVPTKTTQSDVFQVRFAAHGEYSIPVLAPWSAQEGFDLTVKAFNIANTLRTPVILLTDAALAHTWERVEVKGAGEVCVRGRKPPTKPPGEFRPYEPDENLVPRMAYFGEGYGVLVESLAHDYEGFYAPNTEEYARLVRRLVSKIERNAGIIIESATYMVSDAEYLIYTYGSTARSAYAVVKELRHEGVKVGMFRPKALWPFDARGLRKAASGARKVFVVENNLGKMVGEVERVLKDKEVIPVNIIDLEVPSPEAIEDEVRRWL